MDCQLKRDQSGELNSASCENVAVKLSDSALATLDHLDYMGSGDTAMTCDGKIFENNTQKATFTATVPRGGEVQFKITENHGNP